MTISRIIFIADLCGSIVDNYDANKLLLRLQSLTDSMSEMIEIAMEDDQISEDEKELLLNVNKNIEEYAKRVISSIEDGIVEESEVEGLKEFEREIKAEAEKIARKDQVVTRDELALLEKVISILETEW